MASAAAPAAPRARRTGSGRLGGWAVVAGGAAAVLAVWCAVAWTLSDEQLVPYPWEIVQALWRDRSLLAGNTWPTLWVAAQGFFWGNLVVVPLAAIALLWPAAEPVVSRLGVVVHAVPFIAIAPILIVALPGGSAKVVITALMVYFPSLIGVLLGLHGADSRALDVVRAAGGTSRTALLKVRFPAALPQVFAGLRIATPAALLGALVAEFFGADRGLGAFIVQSQTAMEVERTWATAVYIGLLAGAVYALISFAARLATPWAGKETTAGAEVAGAGAAQGGPAQRIAGAVLSAALLLGLWQFIVSGLNLDPFFAKGPGDVLSFLTGDGAGEFWSAFGSGLGQTVIDAGTGFAVGTLVAVLAAVAMVAWRPVERLVLPLAIVLRSVPLIAMTPLIVLVFGRGLAGVSVVITLGTFFPTLVNLLVALRSAPAGAADVVRAAGGSSLSAAMKVRMPYAVPALTASARIAIPNAVVGATLAEWLATGKGLGHLITDSYERLSFDALWSSGVLVVLLVLALYALIGWVDGLVARRFGLAG
ncbi:MULTISPECIES: ABC transporter permease [Actinomadura]|uniref:ABC transporter permease n=1 Tax=Actinomadura yumaensis TaxID=111807 RepID=A0ABW2CVY4_9ACTN|nr:ABC transporter permease subunit [Actinomadura sp. J1-007]